MRGGRRKSAQEIRHDSMGSSGHRGAHGDEPHAHHPEIVQSKNFDSLTYITDESDVWHASVATDHYRHRGEFWNEGKHKTAQRYVIIFLTGTMQAVVAYLTNIASNHLITGKFEFTYHLLAQGHGITAFFYFVLMQLMYACMASIFVWIEPVSAGSGIPEVKCFLNGIDLDRIGDLKTGLCKVLGVICSVSAGLPVGKEGPMVHSGSVVATTLSSTNVKNDEERRDYVACGAAAGVCTAFSAPIGGILFALEEGASYWGPSLTWRTFFCSMVALTALYLLNTIGSALGKVGFNKLFSFGNFVFDISGETSYYVYELFLFVAIGAIGGIVGAVFNNTNEKITHYRIKHVNHTKKYRFVEVMCISLVVSCVSFLLPVFWGCTPLPDDEDMPQTQIDLLDELVPFACEPGKEYNELASLFMTDAGAAIRQLFHLHHHAFSPWCLFIFFAFYISLAVVVYGIAVPSGLFVPSLLSGAAFGRLFGNLALRLHPKLAFSNTYALIGAAAVLGGMARMTISLTVILLECTGNEQFVLPLMLTLMTARIVGGLFNDDLYHIHIHMKKGVHFLESELRSVTRHHNLTASDVMSDHVVFLRPIETVEKVYDLMRGSTHSNYVIVDPDDNNIIYGTIPRNALCILLQMREFGVPAVQDMASHRTLCNYLEVEREKFVPLVQWQVIERAYPKYPTVEQLRISESDRDKLVDLRPYCNQSPITVHEAASVERTYSMFRNLGLRFLPVVNKYNQVVGTITRSDLTPDALAETMLMRGKKKRV